MVLSNPFPGHTALTTFADLRRDLEGLVVRNAAGVMRAGVFPDHLNPIVTGRSDMKVNIADFRAVQNRGGAVLIANVGTDTSVTLPAAPGANKRIDLIYVTMRSTALADAASTPIFGFVQGTASATPVAPSLPGNLSTAIPLATVEIPAGATTTLSGGVVITQVYPYTALAGGTVVVRNSVELAAWTPADGARAYCVADGSEYLRKSSAWVKPGGVIASGTVTAQSSFTIDGLTGASKYEVTLILPTASAANDLNVRLRSGGVTDTTASAYDRQSLVGAVTTAAASNAMGANVWAGIAGAARTDKTAILTFTNLNAAERTVAESRVDTWDATANPNIVLSGLRHRTAAAYDGIWVEASTGTVTGRYEVRAL